MDRGPKRKWWGWKLDIFGSFEQFFFGVCVCVWGKKTVWKNKCLFFLDISHVFFGGVF